MQTPSQASKRTAVTQPKTNLDIKFHGRPARDRDEHHQIRQRLGTLTVIADSMRPYYEPGDILECDGEIPAEGAPVVAKVDDVWLVARWERVGTKLVRFTFDNPAFKTFTVPACNAMVARVSTMFRQVA